MEFLNPLIYGLCYWFAPWMLKRATSGKYNGVFIEEGQRWKLIKSNDELPYGIYVVRSYEEDRVIIGREDRKKTNLPIGCIPLYAIDYLLANFELVKS
jgi:hypothetical protein